MSLIDLSNLSKPADTLIKKISDAVGGIFEPAQIRRIARAKADAALVNAESEIQITDLHRRAARRWIEEEAQRQKNIEDVTVGALPDLNEESSPDTIEDDWITNFFDKSRIVSDSEMQTLWSRVLAGEANRPGTYSKRTVNFLSDLDKAEAELFSTLCGFCWVFGNVTPLVFDTQAEMYQQYEINFGTLSHLESIGLIRFNNLTGFVNKRLPKRFVLHYYGRPLVLEMPKESDNEIGIGHVLLTRIGQELAPICEARPVDGFFDYVVEKWKEYHPQPGGEIKIGE